MTLSVWLLFEALLKIHSLAPNHKTRGVYLRWDEKRGWKPLNQPRAARLATVLHNDTMTNSNERKLTHTRTNSVSPTRRIITALGLYKWRQIPRQRERPNTNKLFKPTFSLPTQLAGVISIYQHTQTHTRALRGSTISLLWSCVYTRLNQLQRPFQSFHRVLTQFHGELQRRLSVSSVLR